MVDFKVRSTLNAARHRESSFRAIGRYFSRQALESERFFASIANAKSLNFLPREYCGFECEVRPRATLSCIGSYDPRAVVSLALMKPKPILSAYANKTPIMCVNVNRLMYTVAIFEFAARFEDPVSEALDFLIATDIQSLDDFQRESLVAINPNQLFSRLLHCLRASGYEAYVFAIATRLNFDVDLVRCHTRDDSSAKTLFRYRRLRPDKREKIGIGVITAVNYGDRWFVKVTKSAIVT